MLKEGKNQISVTDSEAKLMKSRDGFVVCYNNQTAVDSKSHLIAGFEVTDKVCDFGLITELAKSVRNDFKDFGEKNNLITTLADKGYQDSADMMKALENGIIPNVIQNRGKEEVILETDYEDAEITEELLNSTDSKNIQKCLRAGFIPSIYKANIKEIKILEKKTYKKKETKDFEIINMNTDEMMKKAKSGYFVRNPEANVVYCPSGKTLRQETIKKNGSIRYRNRTACKNCTSKCTNSVYKYVAFSKDETIKNASMSHKEKRPCACSTREIVRKKIVKINFIVDKKALSHRQSLSEHPFGTVKRTLNSYYLLLKGKKKVTAEMSLIFLAYNMRRAINIAGIGKMIGIMK